MLERSPVPDQLEMLRSRYPQPESAQLAEIVYGILNTLNGDLTARDAALLSQVEELAATMSRARAEISALRADDINQSHIPSATDELDAIVAHTATATDSILECCERLDTVAAAASPEHAQVLRDVTTAIYEACSFQDITGQRITKVVGTLKAIEEKVAHILDVFAGQGGGGDPPPPPAAVAGDGLLNGPQLPGSAAAMGQSDIDALLASFD